MILGLRSISSVSEAEMLTLNLLIKLENVSKVNWRNLRGSAYLKKALIFLGGWWDKNGGVNRM